MAKRIDKSYDQFYLELFHIDKLELDPWTNPVDLPAIVKTSFTDIFRAELEILSAEIENDAVAILCDQHDKNVDYSVGKLTISCQEIKVFDQDKNELTIGQFGQLCEDYWKEWSKR